MSDYNYLSSLSSMSNLYGLNSSSSTTGLDSAEKLYGANMMQKIMKSGLGDGMEFELVLQALMDSMKDSSSSTNSLLGSLYGANTFSTSAGQILEDLPLERANNGIGYLTYNSYYNNYNIGNVSTSSSDATKQQIYDSVNKYCSEYGVDPKLVLALIKVESDFQPNVTSSAGAMGLMQLMPSVCKQWNVQNPYSIDDNIKGGVQLLKYHLDNYNGDIPMALMAYGAGAGTVQARGVTSVADLYKMPEETQNHIPKVMNYYINGVE